MAAFFKPQNGNDDSVTISLRNSSAGHELDGIYDRKGSGNPVVGVRGLVTLSSSATLNLTILGSIRTMRDYIDGGRTLQPVVQDAIEYKDLGQGSAGVSRLWLDNVTTTWLSFKPSPNGSVSVKDQTLNFDAGTYEFSASFNYPQLTQLSTRAIFSQDSQQLAESHPQWADSLSFLSYTDKLLAGGWKFLTYFGRDSMLTLLLMGSVLSTGEGSATEAVIAAVLERLNRHDGSTAHEETIGDYATFKNIQAGNSSTDPSYDYKMVDTDFFLPIVLANYLVENPAGKERASAFLDTKATVNPETRGMTYRELALINACRVMDLAAPFAREGGQTRENLIALRKGQETGQWRDSNYGLGGGRIPYDVNTALVPAGLRAIETLVDAGHISEHPEWKEVAGKFAQVWEDETLDFFKVHLDKSTARSRVEAYLSGATNLSALPSHSDEIDSDVVFHGLALNEGKDKPVVDILNTDDCFRLFLLSPTNGSQLSSFLNQVADNILRPFPAGLSTDAGLLVASPAYSDNEKYWAGFTNADYHGTVVWSWQLAMMAAGLERQLGRCGRDAEPAFCGDSALYSKVKSAYNHLWDLIDANSANLAGEVWSWKYEGGKFVSTPLGSFTATESDVVQLWSLTFLAVQRRDSLR